MNTVRRHRLAAPRVALAPAVAAAAATPPRQSRLPAAQPAPRRLRRLFDPARGRIRRLERAAGHLLGRHVFPRIPGLHALYDPQLRYGLTLAECEVPLPGLDIRLDGLRLLLVTDVHAGAFVSPHALQHAFERLVAFRPDAVLLGGDLATAHEDEVASIAPALRRLRAPLGTWAVLGNHDHYTGAVDRLCATLTAAGIEVLHNRGDVLRANGAALSLAGVDDALVGRPDLDAALAGLSRPVVLLSHNPDLFFDAAARGVGLMLSGHTHAGQIRFPGRGVIVRQSRYRLDEGWFHHDDAQLIVSRGLGVVGVPLRFGCPPEAVLVTLRRAPGRPGSPGRAP